jgi:molybdate transport system substrate-binding protein
MGSLHDRIHSGSRRFLVKLFITLPLMYACGQNPSEAIQVSCASSLRYVMPEIVSEYERIGETRVAFSFASSGAIYQQIRSGAPIDLFCSADSEWIEKLLTEGLVEPSSVTTYAIGKLVVSCSEELVEMPTSVESLKSVSISRVAWANPDLAPYGFAAQQVIIASGVKEDLEPKAVVGENVGQVLIYLTRGDVDCAFLPLSFVKWSGERYLALPSETYRPIEQVLAVPKSGRSAEGGSDFARFILSPVGRRILAENGFSLPPEEERDDH